MPFRRLGASISPAEEKEEMKKSIEAMKQEAQKRLKALSKEVSEYQIEKQNLHYEATTNMAKQPSTLMDSMDSMEEDLTNLFPWDVNEINPTTETSSSSSVVQPEPKEDFTKQHDDAIQIHHADANRLEHTRWKIMFNLGREVATWMPPAWGASGDRLRFSIVIELTSEPFTDGHEDFFNGMAGAKILRVVEANLGPTFFDSEYHCQQQLQLAETGGYKVIRGAGPSGTDVLGFFIETREDIRSSSTNSDVYCPKGRIYINCGYFPVYSSMDTEHYHVTHSKDILRQEYRIVASKYDELKREADDDARLISIEQMTRYQQIHKLHKNLRTLELRIQEARQRNPEKSQLRLSRKGDVGLSKEGGVCCKVIKGSGVAIEYHILGRLELASAASSSTPNTPEHEDFEDFKHKLRP